MLVSLANSLIHNKKLKELILEDDGSKDYIVYITITKWDSLSNVLCNKTSINATFDSNHTLERILEPEQPDTVDESLLPPDLRSLLQMNRENTKFEAARRRRMSQNPSGAFQWRFQYAAFHRYEFESLT